MGLRRLHQQTLAGSVELAGIGLHTGTPVGLRLLPAPPDAGVTFRRVDLAPNAGARDRTGFDIPARHDQVVATRLATTLGNAAGVTVATVEHLLAALAGLGIDNLLIEIDGPEVPAMDGSAAPFARAMAACGIAEQDAPLDIVRVIAPIIVPEAGRSVALLPSDELEISCEIDFASAAIGRQSVLIRPLGRAFLEALAPARTFALYEEVEAMQAAGLARGGSLDNAIVVAGEEVLNPGGLRAPDEFARHKALDALGDLFLVGAPVIARYVGVKAGHEMNHRLLAALFAARGAWRIEAAGGTAAAEAAPMPAARLVANSDPAIRRMPGE